MVKRILIGELPAQLGMWWFSWLWAWRWVFSLRLS
jgi:hypothetical protein